MIDLDELMRLHAAATPGPWKIGAWNGIVAESPRGVEWDKALFSVALNAEKTAKADAAYICAACNAVPELVARIRELETELYEAVGCIISNESQTMIDCRICFFEQYCECKKDQWKPDHEMCRKAIMKYVTPEETEENAGR